MKIVTIGKYEYPIPSSWEELSTRQMELIAIASLQSLTPIEMSVKACLGIMGLSVCKVVKNEMGDYTRQYLVMYKMRTHLVSAFQVNYIRECMNFLFKENEVFPNRITNPYPSLPIKLMFGTKTLYGPAEGLTNLTLDEWIQAEVERIAWERGKCVNPPVNSDMLYNFIAILWRPTSKNHPDGDMRAPLRQDSLKARAKMLKKYLSAVQVRVILWWYYGCNKFLYDKFDYVFTGGSTTDDFAFDNFVKMVNGLAQNDLYKIETIRRAPLIEALYNLNITVEEHNKQKRKDAL